MAQPTDPSRKWILVARMALGLTCFTIDALLAWILIEDFLFDVGFVHRGFGPQPQGWAWAMGQLPVQIAAALLGFLLVHRVARERIARAYGRPSGKVLLGLGYFWLLALWVSAYLLDNVYRYELGFVGLSVLLWKSLITAVIGATTGIAVRSNSGPHDRLAATSERPPGLR